MTAKPRRISKRWIQKTSEFLGNFPMKPISATQNVSVNEALNYKCMVMLP